MLRVALIVMVFLENGQLKDKMLVLLALMVGSVQVDLQKKYVLMVLSV